MPKLLEIAMAVLSSRPAGALLSGRYNERSTAPAGILVNEGLVATNLSFFF